MSTAPPVADPALVARLRADLERAPYTVEAVGELLGPLASAAIGREQVLPAQRGQRGADCLLYTSPSPRDS